MILYHPNIDEHVILLNLACKLYFQVFIGHNEFTKTRPQNRKQTVIKFEFNSFCILRRFLCQL